MALLGLGYAGFGSADLDDWRQFGTSLVGLQAVERGNSLLGAQLGRPVGVRPGASLQKQENAHRRNRTTHGSPRNRRAQDAPSGGNRTARIARLYAPGRQEGTRGAPPFLSQSPPNICAWWPSPAAGPTRAGATSI